MKNYIAAVLGSSVMLLASLSIADTQDVELVDDPIRITQNGSGFNPQTPIQFAQNGSGFNPQSPAYVA